MNRNIIIVSGPTAVGKTKYAIEIAMKFNGEIVSCDSMQLYKYMDIGSAKPTAHELSMVPHHLVDEIDPREPFSAAKYSSMARASIEEIFNKGKTPIIAGGTGLYLNSILYDMDFSSPPSDDSLRDQLYEEADKFGNDYIYHKLMNLDKAAAERIHPNNVKKVVRAIEAATNGEGIKDISKVPKLTNSYSATLIGLTRNRDQLYDRINQRVEILIDEGLVKEVEDLLNLGLTEENISMKGIGYKEIIGYINNQYSLDFAIDLIKKNTRHYAKRQLTWFKRYDSMKWFNISDYSDDEHCLEDIYKWLEKQ